MSLASIPRSGRLAGESIRNWRVADATTRQRHTRLALTQIVEGDAKGRTLHEARLPTGASRF